MKRKEMIDLVKQARNKAEETYKGTIGSDNRIIQFINREAYGKYVAYDNVLELLYGNAVYLRIDI